MVYGSKSDKLLLNLKKKFPNYHQPSCIKFSELARLRYLYDIPLEFDTLLPRIPSNTCYYDFLDIRSEHFDAEKAFENGYIITSENELSCADNIAKIRQLIPNLEHDCNIPSTKVQTKKVKRREKLKPIFERIALHTLNKCNNMLNFDGMNQLENEERNIHLDVKDCKINLSESPYCLLNNILNNRIRCLVIIRKNSRYNIHNKKYSIYKKSFKINILQFTSLNRNDFCI